jgi:phosphoglycolate phosphatase-like HAD superfamily hydrolase
MSSPGTTIQRDPRGGEPRVRAAMFSDGLDIQVPQPALLSLADDVVVVTSDLVERAKPDPRLFLAAALFLATARRLGVDPAHCFLVGDSIWDLLAAQRAGALGIGREELDRSGAHRVYADPAEMLTRLEEVGVRPIR